MGGQVKIGAPRIPTRLLAMALGVVVGYAPLLFMLAVVPGFYDLFTETVRNHFFLGATNLGLPVPWPWTVDYSSIGFRQATRALLIGFHFLFVPAFLAFCVVYLLATYRAEPSREKVVLLSCIAVGVPTLHHAFARADLAHLAQSIHPSLLAMMVLPYVIWAQAGRRLMNSEADDSVHVPSRRFRSAVVVILLFLSIMSVLPLRRRPLWYAFGDTEDFVEKEIAGDRLRLTKTTSELIDAMLAVDELIDANEGLLIQPYWPAIYVILGRTCPLYELHFLLPALPARKAAMIQALEGDEINWIVLSNRAPDGRNELRFKNLHRRAWQIIEANYEPYPFPRFSSGIRLLRRKH